MLEPRLLRQIEYVSGILTAVFGLILPAYGLLFAPRDFLPATADLSVLLVWVAGVVVTAGMAILDSKFSIDTGIGFGLGLLWAASGTLWAFVVTGLLTINLFVLPAAIFGLIAALAGSLAQVQISRAT